MAKKRIVLFFLALFACFMLTGCKFFSFLDFNNNEENEEEINEIEEEETYKIYRLAVTSGYDGTYEEWLRSIKGEKGDNGIGILSIIKTKSEGLVDTYTITYTDRSTTTFTITNGRDGINGTNGKDGKDGANGTNGINGKDGINGTNGVDGKDGINGTNGKDGASAYELYKKAHPDYTKTEEEWLNDLTNGNLAVAEIVKYTVSFNSNGGSSIESQEVIELHNAVKPADPIKEGFTFDGWYVGDEKWVFSGYLITCDLELNAKWIANDYTITIDSNGGICDINILNVKYNESIVLPVPSKEGYSFGGWYSGNRPFEKEKYDIATDITLIAKWNSPYTITFNSNGGTEIDDLAVIGIVSELPVPTRDADKFLGWYLGDELVELPFDYNGDEGVIMFKALWKEVAGDFDYIVHEHEKNENASQSEMLIITKPDDAGEWGWVGLEVASDLTGYNKIVATVQGTIAEEILFKANDRHERWFKLDGTIQDVEYTFPESFVWDYSRRTIILFPNPGRAGTDHEFVITKLELHGEGKEPINLLTGCLDCSERMIYENKVLEEDEYTIEIIAYNGNDEEITIPSSINGIKVTNIADNVFKDNSTITKIKLPDTIKVIGNYAFANMSSLEELDLNGGVVTYGTNILLGSSNLKKITMNASDAMLMSFFDYEESNIPDNLIVTLRYCASNLKASEGVFKNLTYRSSIHVVLDESWRKIRLGFFANCKCMRALTLPNTIRTIGGESNHSTFYGCDYLNSLYVESFEVLNAITKYECPPVPNIYINNKLVTDLIVPIGVTEITDGTFSGCTSLETIVLPNTLETIGQSFYGCKNLKYLIIPDGVTSIKSSAFSGCSSLKYIVIPETLKNVDYAFGGLSSLENVYYKGTKTQWFDRLSTCFQDYSGVNVYYFSETEPTTTGNWWHYVDDEPTIW